MQTQRSLKTIGCTNLKRIPYSGSSQNLLCVIYIMVLQENVEFSDLFDHGSLSPHPTPPPTSCPTEWSMKHTVGNAGLKRRVVSLKDRASKCQNYD